MTFPTTIAVDTETTLILPVAWSPGRLTRLAPYTVPDLVCGSLYSPDFTVAAGALTRVPFLDHLEAFLVPGLTGIHLVFHNAAFDIPVILKARPSLRPSILSAVENGWVHDTMLLEPLLQIARGATTIGAAKIVYFPRLSDLALRRAGLHLSKDDDIRLTFGQFLCPTCMTERGGPSPCTPSHNCPPIPPEHLAYASEDARATYEVFKAQWREYESLKGLPSDYPIYEDVDRFGPLTERIQIQGSLAFAWLEQFPVRVDVPAVKALHEHLSGQITLMEDALVSFKWANRKRPPRTPKGTPPTVFASSHKTIRVALEKFCSTIGTLPPRSPTGLVSMEYDYWSGILPKITRELHQAPALATTPEDRLAVWHRWSRIKRHLTNYVFPYLMGERHYPRYSVLGARSGRTACSRPNVQQIPKRKDGIRGLFIPEDGWLLVEADYVQAELVALAQVYHLLYGSSNLGTDITAGQDVHVSTARRVRSDYDTLGPADQKLLRTAAKAFNFGLPGGLGSKTLQSFAKKSFGVDLSVDESRHLRECILEADPALARYLQLGQDIPSKLRAAAQNLHLPLNDLYRTFDGYQKYDRDGAQAGDPNPARCFAHLRLWACGRFEPKGFDPPPGFDPEQDLFRTTTRTPTGRVRGRSTYTASHNTPFQGLVADAGKIACWNLYKRWHPDCGWAPVAFIHDAFLLQARSDLATTLPRLLTDCMVGAFSEVCPALPGKVECTEPLPRWGKNTNPFGEEIQ